MSPSNPIAQKLARHWLPPALRSWINHRSGNALRFRGGYARWEDAARHGRYDDERILQQVIAAADAAESSGRQERDGQLVDDAGGMPDALTAALLAAALDRPENLRVIDFGGALGSHWRASRAWHEALPPLRWHVVEQRHYVDAGRQRGTDERLQFDYSLDEALAALGLEPDLLIASSVLPYLPEPHRQFDRFLEGRPRWLLLDRMPYLDGERDLLCLQQNPRRSGGARYPCWLFAADAFTVAWKRAGYRSVADWAGADGIHRIDGRRIEYRGCLLWRRDS